MSDNGTTDDVVVCRACNTECLEYRSLYKQGFMMGELTTLAALLGFCTNIDFMMEEDFMPKHICTDCIQNLAKSYTFKKTVLQTDKLLRKQYEAFGTDGEQEGETTSGEQNLVKNPAVEPELFKMEEPLGEAGDFSAPTIESPLKDQIMYGEDVEYMTLTVMTGEEDHQMEGVEHLEADSESDIVVTEEEEEEVDESRQEQQEINMHVLDDSAQVFEVLQEIETEAGGADDNSDEQLKTEREDAEDTYDETESYDALDEWQLNDGKPSLLDQSSDNEPDVKRNVKGRRKNNAPKQSNPDLKCPVCGKQLSNNNSFKYHMQLHSDATPYLCSLCGEGFKTRNAYEGHIIIHDPNNPNTCEACGKAYRQASSLRAHLLTHTGEKPFRCDICGKGMTQKSGYKKHMLTHTGEKPHTCDICGRDFRYSSNLIAHKRCHSTEKPYECNDCEKSFHTAEQLKRHKLVHTGDRPFPCNQCSKTFKRRTSLLSHRHTHENDQNNDHIEDRVATSNVIELL